MPIYEYQCKKCGETTEIMQKFSDPPLRVCPICGSRVAKLMSMNSFKLNGSGWYVTDYAKGRNKEAAASGKDTPGKDAAPSAKEKETAAAPAAGGSAEKTPPPPKKEAPAPKEARV